MIYRFGRTHPLGFAFCHPGMRIAYIPIPKCASSSIKSMLRRQGFRQTTLVPPNYHTFTVIREPFSRLVSGICEYLGRNLNPALHDDTLAEIREELAGYLFTPRDEHTTPQHVFLTRRIDHLIAYDHLSFALPKHLTDLGLTEIPNLPLMQTTPPEATQLVTDQLKDVWSPNHDPIDDLLYRYALLGHR